MNKDGRTPRRRRRRLRRLLRPGGVGDSLTLDANRYLNGGRLQYVVTDPAILDTIKVTNGSVVSAPTAEILNRFSQPQNTRVDSDARAPRSIQGSALPGATDGSLHRLARAHRFEGRPSVAIPEHQRDPARRHPPLDVPGAG